MLYADRLTKELKNVLKRLGMKIVSRNGDVFEITDNHFTFKADMSGYRDFEDISADELEDIVVRLQKEAEAESRMVSFTNGQAFLRYILLPEEEVTEHMVSADFAAGLKKVVVCTVDDVHIKLFDEKYLLRWAVPKEVAVSAADKNMCRLMDSCEFVETGLRTDLKAVEIEPKYPVFTAAFIACNNFRAKMSKLLGEKYIVLAPSSSSVIALENLTKDVADEIGRAVVKEYRTAERPLTTAALVFDQSSISEAGKFTSKGTGRNEQ